MGSVHVNHSSNANSCAGFLCMAHPHRGSGTPSPWLQHTLTVALAHTTVQWHEILKLVPEMRQVCWCSSVLLQYAWNSVQFADLDLPLSPLNVQMMLHTFSCHVCMPLSIKPLEWTLFSPDVLHHRHVSITAFHKIKKILVCGNTRWTSSVLLFLWKMMDFRNESCLSKEKRGRK